MTSSEAAPAADVEHASEAALCSEWFETTTPTTSASKGKDHKLFCRCWNPDITLPVGIVFTCHGIAEHLGAYDDVAAFLCSKNLLVFGHDHAGHGQSEGKRGNIEDFSRMVEDVMSTIIVMKKRFPSCPVFIAAHSLGGLIALDIALKDPDFFKGIVLIGPSILPAGESFGPVVLNIIRVLGWLAPSCPVKAIDSQFVSRDPSVVAAYEADPLNYHGRLNARTGAQVLTATERIKSSLDKISTPLLTIQGEEDKICATAGATLLQSQAQSKDKTLSMYKGCSHQVHKEPDGDNKACFEEIAEWILARI